MAPTLAQLDARCPSWPWPLRVLYLSVKWGLVALGVYLVIGLAYRQWTAGQFGLGIGMVTATLMAITLGVINAVRGSSGSSSPPQTGRE